MPVTGVTIVGAGPYGLSLAAHLREQDMDYRVIGTPMHSWRTKMPEGMLLKSPGFASTLFDPEQKFTLRKFCQDQGIPYEDIDLPVPLDTFCAYGMAFQERFAPDVEDDVLQRLHRSTDGFVLNLKSGKTIKTRKVVLAVGIDYFRQIPEPLIGLPRDLCSHSADHRDLHTFQGCEVAVIGGGASASDLAILLHERGTKVQLIARKPKINFGDGAWGGVSRPLLRRLRAPISAIGPGWRSRFYSDAPGMYRHLPEKLRVHVAATHLGPSGGWFMRERASEVPSLLGYVLRTAEAMGQKVRLELIAADGTSKQIWVDHVIAATGYRQDVARLPFLGPDTLGALRLTGTTPRLSADFESSVSGLYFMGAIAVTSFGPVMRFAAGAGFAARRISRHLLGLSDLRTQPVSQKDNWGSVKTELDA